MKKCEKIALNAMISIYQSIGIVKRSSMVMTTDVADSYLEQILVKLRNAKLIKTKRGASGGYMLARPAHQITVFQIVSCMSNYKAPESSSIGGIELEIWKSSESVMSRLTLPDLSDRVLRYSSYDI